MNKYRRIVKGFSLVELVTVMILLGILSVHVALKIDSSAGKEQQACRESAELLRITKAININQGIEQSIYFVSNTTGKIGICLGKNSASSVDECKFEKYWHNVDSFGGVSSTSSEIIFNSFGQLDQLKSSSSSLSFTSDSGKCVVSVNQEGAVSWKIEY